MVTKSIQYNITAMTQIPLYDLEEAAIQGRNSLLLLLLLYIEDLYNQLI